MSLPEAPDEQSIRDHQHLVAILSCAEKIYEPGFLRLSRAVLTRRYEHGELGRNELRQATCSLFRYLGDRELARELRWQAETALASPAARRVLQLAGWFSEDPWRVAELVRVGVIASMLGPPWVDLLASSGAGDVVTALEIVEEAVEEVYPGNLYWSSAVSRCQTMLAGVDRDRLWADLDERLGPARDVKATEAVEAKDPALARAWERVPLDMLERLDASGRRVGLEPIGAMIRKVRGEARRSATRRGGRTRTEQRQMKACRQAPADLLLREDAEPCAGSRAQDQRIVAEFDPTTESVTLAELHEEAQARLARLPPEDAELVRRHLEGASFRQLAREKGVHHSKLQRAYERAVATLRERES